MNTKIIFLSFIVAFSSQALFGQENYRTLVMKAIKNSTVKIMMEHLPNIWKL
jgi:hypothetical protein